MYKRNISNISSFNEINASNINIQGNGSVLNILGADSSVPLYTFDTTTNTFNVSGDFNVTGTAQFTNTNITQISGGIVSIAASNTADIIDIGVSGKTVVGGITYYTGMVRSANDTLRRYTLYDNVTTLPTTTVSINSTTLAALRTSSVYVNDGTASSPSIVFDLNSTRNTGFYRKATNTIGISANGTDAIIVSDTQNTSVNDFKMSKGIVKANLVLSTASLTLTNQHYMVECSFSGAVTITLPSVSGNTGREYIIVKTSVSGTNVTISTSGGDHIDDASSTSIVLSNQYDRATLVAGSTLWYTV
jgi:hypothetical protein